MATHYYYKEIVDPDDESKKTPVALDSLFAVKPNLSANVPKEQEVGYRDGGTSTLGRDLSNLFMLIANDKDKQYVPAIYAEPSYMYVEKDNVSKDLSELFALKSATGIVDETVKAKALSELASGAGPRVQNSTPAAHYSLSTIPLSNLGVNYKMDIYGRNIYGDNPDEVFLANTDYFDSPEGSTSHRFTYVGLGGERWTVVTPVRFL